MKIKIWFLLICVILFAFVKPQDVNATSIGVGLDWRERIFVQEYWVNYRPYYAITNLRNTLVALVVYDRYGNKQLAGSWTVAAQAVAYVDASGLQRQGLISFKLMDGTFLGLLEAPEPATSTNKRNFATYDGLNGSGGRSANPWFEQTIRTFTAGETIELRLLTQANTGIIYFSQVPLYSYEIPELLLSAASCATLPVTVKGSKIFIDTNQPIQEQTVHTIVLHFHAPTVKAPTMYMITGWLDYTDGGRGLTRGVIVNPRVKP